MAELQLSKPASAITRRRLSIRTLIMILTIVLLVLGMIEAGISLAVLRNLQGQTIQTLNSANQVRSLGQNIQSRYFAARQNEAQLMIQSQTQGYNLQSSVYVLANESDLAAAKQNLNDIERLALISPDANLRSLTDEVVRMRPLLDEYEAAFHAYVAAIQKNPQDQSGPLPVDTAAIETVTRNINQEIDRILTKSDFGVNSAQASIERISQQASLTIPIIGVLALIIGASAALLISRQIIPPLNRLSKAAQQMGAGVLDRQVEASGASELATLGIAFNSMADQIKQILAGLEGRVKQQTQKLEESSRQIQFAAEIAHDIASTRSDLEELLNRSVHMIRDRFGFYHAGIFLINETGDYAVLHAATGEAGETMLKREHKLKVGAEGIVGHVTRMGKPRISLDVGADAVHFKNPLLPNTRSEMALPLKVSETVIGALDVQSVEANAFSDQDVSVLQLMADQLAIAIDNTRLFKSAQDNLQQMQQAYGQYSREAWERLGQARAISGYQYDQKGLHPLVQARTGDQNPDPMEPSQVECIPLQVRGQAIGELKVWTESQNGFTRIEQETLKVLADRVSQLMDSARLYEEARVRAAREETLSQLTAQFTKSLRFDVLLQSAVQELGRLPNVTEASIHIGLPDDRSQPGEQN